MERSSLSLIIPVYNEETSIDYVIADTMQNLPKIIPDFEVIVVDDGSKDGTLRIVNSLKRKYKNLRVIPQRHSGFARSIINGISHAKKDYTGYMRGNGLDLVRDLVNCLNIMGTYDLTIGIRGKRIDYDLYRFFLSYGGALLYRVLFNISYEDVHWVYIWKTKEIKKLDLDSKSGIFILVESLIKFRKMGLTIGEATAPYRPRFAGVSKVTRLESVYGSLASAIGLWWKTVKGEI